MTAARRPFSMSSLSHDPDAILKETSIFLYTVGYEQRSSYFADMLGTGRPPFCGALIYEDGMEFGCFEANLIKFKINGHKRVGLTVAAIQGSIQAEFTQEQPITVTVDISCMDRTVMANVFLAIFDLIRPDDTLHVLYTPNEFSEPEFTFPTLKYFGPAVPELNGRVGDFSEELCLIMGLGYEYGASLNVFERLEPAISYLYVPKGFDERFLHSVKQANFDFDFGVRNLHINEFYLENPEEAYRDISSTVLALKHSMAIALVPFGPKLFSFVCLLVAIENAEDVSFLRYSLDNDRQSSTLKSSGITYGVTLSGLTRDRWARLLKSNQVV